MSASAGSSRSRPRRVPGRQPQHGSGSRLPSSALQSWSASASSRQSLIARYLYVYPVDAPMHARMPHRPGCAQACISDMALHMRTMEHVSRCQAGALANAMHATCNGAL